MIEKDILLSVIIEIGPKRLLGYDLFELPKGPSNISDIVALFRKHSVSGALNNLFDQVIDQYLNNPKLGSIALAHNLAFTSKDKDGRTILYNAAGIRFFTDDQKQYGDVLIVLHESNRLVLGIVDCTIADGEALIRSKGASSALN